MTLSINKQILKLAIPSILANITVPLVGIIDLAIAGHIGDAATMGGIAIGTMLFDLLYWNMGFLRVGTGGVTAQAYGRRDMKSAMSAFSQGIATALGVAILVLMLQGLFIYLSFLVVECSPEAELFARQYFNTRIFALPAALMLMVFKGWFIGMQNTLLPMVTDIFVNLTNVGMSWYLGVHAGMGIRGVALGTVIAQWSGLLLASLMMAIRYRDKFQYLNIRDSIRWEKIKDLFKMNVDLLIRSLLMLVIYSGFTSIAAKYGDVELSAASMMMKLLLLYSYFVDGFAYAGEALTGKFIGAGDRTMLLSTIRHIFVWCTAIGILSTIAYGLWSEDMVNLFTTDAAVREGCKPYLFWLLLMPVMSCLAFTWDGIYIGATASTALRNSLIWSAVSFLATYFALKGVMGIQALYLAYFMHVVARSLYQTIVWRKNILCKV